MQMLTETLFTWSADHPEWVPADGGPSGWEPEVHCYGLIPKEPREPVVLIEPLLPAAEDARQALLQRMDRSVDGGSELHVIVGNAWHARGAQEFHDRYESRTRVSIHVPDNVEREMPCRPTQRYSDGSRLPGGVVAHRIDGLQPGEHALWLGRDRFLVFSDALLGEGAGQVRRAPRSWATDDYEKLTPSLRRLVELAPVGLLVSHGPSVLEGGTQALRSALELLPWGEGDPQAEPVEA